MPFHVDIAFLPFGRRCFSLFGLGLGWVGGVWDGLGWEAYLFFLSGFLRMGVCLFVDEYSTGIQKSFVVAWRMGEGRERERRKEEGGQKKRLSLMSAFLVLSPEDGDMGIWGYGDMRRVGGLSASLSY